MANIQKSNLIKEIGNAIKTFNLNTLPEKQLKQVAKLLMIDKAKEELDNEIKKDDFDKIRSLWLDSFQSPSTKRSYSYSLDLFTSYLKDKGVHILDVDYELVDNYTHHIISNTSLSNNSKRQYITTLSGFFNKLKRYGYVKENYFRGSRLPRKQKQKELRVPTDTDIAIIRNTIEEYTNFTGKGHKKVRESAFQTLTIIDLFIETGLRVGAIKTIKVGINGIISGYSKGKNFEKKISLDLAQKLRKIDLPSIKDITIQKAIEKACKRAGTYTYNCHSFRHYFAVKHYVESKDIYMVKELLNHSSILTTEQYLKSLKVI